MTLSQARIPTLGLAQVKTVCQPINGMHCVHNAIEFYRDMVYVQKASISFIHL